MCSDPFFEDEQAALNKELEQQTVSSREYLTVKRKVDLCYYVMKLAQYGDLYSFIEHSDRFDENATRYILQQFLDGIHYLHSHGIVHRDIKPENLLVNTKGRLIIADFSFATRMEEIDCDEIFSKKYDPIIEQNIEVGSELYNAPEVWDNEINLQEVEMKFKSDNDTGIFEYSEIDSHLRRLSMYPKYDGPKADIFSIGVTLFMMHMKSPPFRKAVQKDPYFKRL